MIERYSRPKAAKIWSLQNKFKYFLDVELAVCEAYAQVGKIPQDALLHIQKSANFSLSRIEELEKITNHDFIAFLQCVNECIGDEFSPYMHMGLTSSDVIDTAFALQIRDGAKIILDGLDALIARIKTLAKAHKNTVCLGRSHGIGAEVITFGFKLLNWLDMFERAKVRLERALEDVSIGQISGPVGTYSNIEPEIEVVTCQKLGLKPARISTQVIARDLHANFLSALAILAGVVENCAVEIRHLQRWEVAEVEEGFKSGQKGSSAMPHKKNPIACENLTGLARVIRANSHAALENIALWHERDISHSSVERLVFPDSCILMDFMLHRLNEVLENLVIKPENMISNVQKHGGIIFSQSCMLALTKRGMGREKAYEIVQKEALDALSGGDFRKNMQKHLSESEIKECFSQSNYLKNIDVIFAKFGL
jgi:adenylosuccinate lyase